MDAMTTPPASPPTPAAGQGDDEAPVAAVPRLALRPAEAARALGISRRKLWSITANRTSGIPVVRFGQTVLYPVSELRTWLAQQAEGATE
ncbi:MAG: helix-turn-helix domain-containing protein [Planctomycetota bacterium]|nr:helix-turn-helix domain-containing protein [Planctomycetota bacterium]